MLVLIKCLNNFDITFFSLSERKLHLYIIPQRILFLSTQTLSDKDITKFKFVFHLNFFLIYIYSFIHSTHLFI